MLLPEEWLVSLLDSCRTMYLQTVSMKRIQTHSRSRSAYRRIRSWYGTHPRVRLALNAAILFILFFILSIRRLDPDFGWHLQAGNYIRAHGIPSHDIFTYTARQFPWINHEWGNDVIASLLYGVGGYALLAGLYALLWSGAVVIAGAGARLSVLLLGAFAMFPYAGIRPEAWTAFGLAVTLWLLRSKRRRLTWLLPLLFIPWANLHGGFVLGFALIGYYAIYERRPALFGVLGLSVLASFINGYGPRLYVEVARTLFDPKIHSQIAEWAPFVFPLGSALFIIVWGAGGVLVEGRSIRRWLRPSIPLLLAAMSATRNVPMFVLVALEECGRYVDTIVSEVRVSPAKAWAKRSVVGVICIVALFSAYHMRAQLWPINVDRSAFYPQVGVAYLRAHGCEGGNIFNDYTYGGYLIWQLPSMPVFIDGRMADWTAPNGVGYVTSYLNLLAHPKQYHSEFARYNIRCVLLQHDQQNAAMLVRLRRDQWRPVVNNGVYILLMAPQKV